MDNHLPVSITPFIGRRAEIEAITDLLSQPSCRLLTLVGPGGAGKTRLAVEAATLLGDGFRNGLYFIPLQSVRAPDAIVYAIAEALNISLYERETPRNQLTQYLQPRQLLLILDNFEHLLDGVDLLNHLIELAADIKLLVTSREVLNLQGEHLFEVGGLAVAVGGSPAQADSDAIRLFVARAAQVKRDFVLAANLDDVARICRLVGGMPLGIELAAAWARTLSCADIAAEITRNLDFLTTGLRDVPERHRSMRAVFEHSWTRLTGAEQTAFCRLSVFAGVFNRAAAQAVADATLGVLSALVYQSLLRVNGDGCYAVHELLRQYTLEKLEQEPVEQAQVLERHSAYYLHLLRTLEPKVKSGDQIAALDTIEGALDNIRAAWAYAAEHRRSDLILPAYECLVLYYQMRCHLAEGLTAFSTAAEHFVDGDEATYGWLLLGQCWFSGFSADQGLEQVAAMTRRVINIIERHAAFGNAGMLFMTLWFSRQDRVIELLERNLAAYQAKGDTWGVSLVNRTDWFAHAAYRPTGRGAGTARTGGRAV